MIVDMERELKKVRRARTNPDEHVQFVTQEINKIIQERSKKESSDPVKILGHTLSKVGDLIGGSFERLDTIERNIIVTIQAYQRVKENLVAHVNEKKQSDSIDDFENVEKIENLDNPDGNIRKVGTRPEDKLSRRRKKANTTSEKEKTSEKPKRKRATKKKKTTKTKEV